MTSVRQVLAAPLLAARVVALIVFVRVFLPPVLWVLGRRETA